MRQLQRDGVIRHVGVSNYSLDRSKRAERALGAPVVSDQIVDHLDHAASPGRTTKRAVRAGPPRQRVIGRSDRHEAFVPQPPAVQPPRYTTGRAIDSEAVARAADHVERSDPAEIHRLQLSPVRASTMPTSDDTRLGDRAQVHHESPDDDRAGTASFARPPAATTARGTRTPARQAERSRAPTACGQRPSTSPSRSAAGVDRRSHGTDRSLHTPMTTLRRQPVPPRRSSGRQATRELPRPRWYGERQIHVTTRSRRRSV